MLVFAHRGASRALPENTISAFQLAFQEGADGIEFDTFQHPEGIIVFHDKTLNRTTNGRGFVLSTPLGELQQLDAGLGARIPTLAETLATVPSGRWCNIEIKHLSDVTSWVDEVRNAVTKSGIKLDKLLISSFNHHWLQQISQRWPEVKIGALTASYNLQPCHCAHMLNAYSMNIALDVASAEFIQQALAEGFKVFVYTVDEIEDMQRLAAYGATGIFTNVPDIARTLFREMLVK